jgi:hypothetical protein
MSEREGSAEDFARMLIGGPQPTERDRVHEGDDQPGTEEGADQAGQAKAEAAEVATETDEARVARAHAELIFAAGPHARAKAAADQQFFRLIHGVEDESDES